MKPGSQLCAVPIKPRSTKTASPLRPIPGTMAGDTPMTMTIFASPVAQLRPALLPSQIAVAESQFGVYGYNRF